MASRSQILSTYRSLLRACKGMQIYNFREYGLRRTRDAFRNNAALTDPVLIEESYQRALKDLSVARRQATISQMFSTDKIILEN